MSPKPCLFAFVMEEVKEIWRDIEGFEGHYQVSNLGRVRSLDRIITDTTSGYSRSRVFKGSILNPIIRKNGYCSVVLSDRKSYLIHRLVLLSFIGKDNSKVFVNHKNGIKEDNRLVNLEWATRKQNMNHAFNTGLAHSGDKCYNSKLTNEDVREMLLNNENLSMNQLASKYNITYSSVYKIVKRHTWKRIKI